MGETFQDILRSREERVGNLEAALDEGVGCDARCPSIPSSYLGTSLPTDNESGDPESSRLIAGIVIDKLFG